MFWEDDSEIDDGTAGTPPQHVIDSLAREWHVTSVHEAGHAIGHLCQNLPLDAAVISYRRDDWDGEWHVSGEVRYGPIGQRTRVDDVDAALISLLAGAEAEAYWMYLNEGWSLRDARVRAREHSWFDMKDVPRHLDSCQLSLDHATDLTAELITGHWNEIEAIAAELRDHHHLTGDQLRRWAV